MSSQNYQVTSIRMPHECCVSSVVCMPGFTSSSSLSSCTPTPDLSATLIPCVSSMSSPKVFCHRNMSESFHRGSRLQRLFWSIAWGNHQLEYSTLLQAQKVLLQDHVLLHRLSLWIGRRRLEKIKKNSLLRNHLQMQLQTSVPPKL